MRFRKLIEWFAAWLIAGGLIVCGLAAPQAAFAQRLVDFNASWCGPCQRVRPIVDRLRVSGVAIEACDVDDRSQAASLGYRGESIPLIVGYDAGGREVGRLQGSTECTAENIQQLYAKCQVAAKVGVDPDEDVSHIPTCEPWADARFVKLRDTDQGAIDYTTGAVVEIGGEAVYIVSCAHGKHGKGDAVAVLFSTGANACVADVIATDYRPNEGVDCALLKMRCTPRPESFRLAESEPQQGAKIYLGGFPQAKQYRGRFSVCLELGSNLIADGGAYMGESGGPVVDERGYLCGVINATDERITCCCRLIHLRRLLDACFPNRPGTIVPRADTPPSAGPPNSPPAPNDQSNCDPSRLDAIERAIDGLRDSKQDKGDYATLGTLNEYAKRNDLPTIPTPPDLSGLATKGDVAETHGLIDKILPAVGAAIDGKIAAIPKSAAIATHVLGVPTSLALPMAVVGGPLGVGLSIAALLGYRKLKSAAAGGRQGGGFHRYYESDAIAGRIGPNGVA